ncbi:MAG TPA: glycosyltransferase [Deltaproteobacteria bacterium]|nr:glycosyltransferase [Deltaproteobacteria bacterium]
MGLYEVVLVAYLSLLGLLSLNGLHRLWMVWAWWRRHHTVSPPPPERWPQVTVQLPVFNERYVVERLIRACAELKYPRDKLHIQVLDDSTDDTTEIARAAVDALVADGLDIVLIHRGDRVGFKAGALDEGLERARGDLIAIFDADFVPQPDFLEVMVPHLMAEGIGMVQARWGHINATDSWITRAQATLLDGHFVIEHTARNASGRWFNFNGTAGIWRRQAITDAGGWQHDTLTEDLDLSYRAQLAGWRFVYLPEVVTPAELPLDMAAFKTQQHRWAKGSIQTAKKLLAMIWRSGVGLPIKLEATAHLCANFSYPLVVLLSVLLPWAVVARIEGGGSLRGLLRIDLVLFISALFPFLLFYAAAILGANAGREGRRLLLLPSVLALGLGMALSQTRAVLEGLFGEVGVFVRTPKSGGVGASAYRAAGRGLVGLEVLFTLYLSAACVYVIAAGYIASLPFLLLFAAGYGAVALGSLR